MLCRNAFFLFGCDLILMIWACFAVVRLSKVFLREMGSQTPLSSMETDVTSKILLVYSASVFSERKLLMHSIFCSLFATLGVEQ